MTEHLKRGRRFGPPIVTGALATVTLAVAFGYVTALSRPAGAGEGGPAQLALGQRVYAEACASCHGDNLEGQPNWRVRQANGRLPAPPHDETGHTWHHPDQQLFQITKQGIEAVAPEGYESDMPGFADSLSDDEIWAVLAHIRSTWPAHVRAQQERRTQSYQAN